MFNPRRYALENNWPWSKIVEIADDGLTEEDAKVLVGIHGLGAPYRMVKWCDHQVIGSCALAGWSWEVDLSEYRKEQ